MSDQNVPLAQQLQRITARWSDFGDALLRLASTVGAARPQVEAIRAQLAAVGQANPSALNAEYRRRQRARVKRGRR